MVSDSGSGLKNSYILHVVECSVGGYESFCIPVYVHVYLSVYLSISNLLLTGARFDLLTWTPPKRNSSLLIIWNSIFLISSVWLMLTYSLTRCLYDIPDTNDHDSPRFPVFCCSQQYWLLQTSICTDSFCFSCFRYTLWALNSLSLLSSRCVPKWPAVLFAQSTTVSLHFLFSLKLPSVSHVLSQLLSAENIRWKINHATP